MRVLSLGAGVQSTAMALMAAHGELTPMPDMAIFCDTGWEPQAVYDHLRWLTSPNVLPFPVRIVSAGNLRDDVISKNSARSGRFASVPWFLKNIKPNGAWESGMGRRQCTAHYKLEPLAKAIREIGGYGSRDRVPARFAEVWVGISTDEAHRMKPARVQYMVNRWPLIEAGISRTQCLEWIARHGYPTPPKSSCIGCPFHSDAMWRDMRDNAPAEWADAVAVDAIIRDGGQGRGIRARQFMHRSLVPLAEADLSTAAERGQADLFGNECEGMCGV